MYQADKLVFDENQKKEKKRLTIPLEFIKSSDRLVGERYYSSKSLNGTLLGLLLKVKSLDKDVPINMLEFYGYSFLQAGDRIRAYVKKYNVVNTGDYGVWRGTWEGAYVEREFKEKERVTFIEKIGKEGQTLALFKGFDPDNC